jgi:hypothetical protein
MREIDPIVDRVRVSFQVCDIKFCARSGHVTISLAFILPCHIFLAGIADFLFLAACLDGMMATVCNWAKHL